MRLVYFSPVAWDSYQQRPHYVVQNFLQSGGSSVVWIDPYPSRLPGWRDLTRSDLRAPKLILARPAGLSVVSVRGLPIDPLPGGPRVNARLFWKSLLADLARGNESRSGLVSRGNESRSRFTVLGIGRPTELALAALRTVQARFSFYDAMDDFPLFYQGRSRAATARTEQLIADAVNRILVSSSRLAEKFSPLSRAGKPVLLLPNAFDMSRFTRPVRNQAATHFGFLGCMGSWFDWTVTARIAASIAPAPVTLAGPQASRVPRRLPANIVLKPQCSAGEGSALVETFTAGLIPFLETELTDSVDPIKYYQYRGAGLPVISTRFGGMRDHAGDNGLFLLERDDGFQTAIAAAVAYRPDERDILRFRADHDWSARFRAARLWEFP